MFRANRIGSPWIHITQDKLSTAAWTAAEFQPTASDNFGVNIINAAADLDFGQQSLYTIATEAIAADRRWGLGHQFTITEPLEGETVGVEVTNSLVIPIPMDALVYPVFGEMNAATSAVNEGATLTNQPTVFGPIGLPIQGNVNVVPRAFSYKEQFIVNGGGLVAGAYFHGFQIYSVTGYNVTWFHMCASVRQLNDQEDIGYRDTRR